MIFATTQQHPLSSRVIQRNSREARALGLTETSYFYGRNIRLIERSRLEKVGRAPPGLFLHLAALAEVGLIEAWDREKKHG